MNSAWNQFLTALMLLTRAPVSRWCRYSPEAVAASVAFFPAVGAIVGLVGALTLGAAAASFPPSFAVLLSMLATVLFTGAFHEDGMADAADGLFGGQTPQKRLEIMKDSRLGSYGAIALWFGLSAKFLLLQALVSRGIILAMYATVVAHALGRAAAVGVLQLQPHVGSDSGRAQPFCRRLPSAQLIATLAPPAIATVVVFNIAGVPVLAACALVVFLGSIFFEKRLGGITGDCLGATVQITEISVLAVVLSKS